MRLLEIIQEDWTYRLPERLRYNRYVGVNRVCFQFWCVIFYALKTVLLFVPTIYYYFFYGLYRLLGLFFERDVSYEDEQEYEESIENEYEDEW